MFQKNLQAIKEKNPQLAKRLEQIDRASITGIEVFTAESKDLIISYKNIPLHSAIDPKREANTTWNRTVKTQLKKNDIQIVFGLGLGYLFKRAYVNSESKIFIIEPFIEVIRFVLEYVDFSNELSDERVYITDNVGDIYNKMQKEYLSGDKIEFLFLNPYTQANQNLFLDLTSKTIEIIEGKKNDENSIFNLSKFWTENFIKNIVHFPEMRPLGFFEGKFADKVALIISAGPSLADDIEKIKNNQDKFVIIAVGKVFKTLAQAGIVPDFTVFADARYCADQTEGVEDALANTNLILLSKSDNYVCNLKAKSKLIYFLEIDNMAKLFQGTTVKTPGFYKSGSSVSIISYYVAKALGFKQIVFSGLDLAFIDNKAYANGQKVKIDEFGNIKFATKNIIYVKDKNGNEIPTRDDYALFIRQFSEILTEEINLASVINTSLKGAFIEGMEYLEFSELLKTLSSEDKSGVDEIISSVFTETKENWDLVIKNVYSKIKQANEELEKINIKSVELYEEFNKICTEFREKGRVNYDNESFEILNNNSLCTRENIINNVFTSNLMQKTIWKYSQNYITKTLPDSEDIIKNLEFDRDFFKDAKDESSYLIKILQEAINIIEKKQEIFSK